MGCSKVALNSSKFIDFGMVSESIRLSIKVIRVRKETSTIPSRSCEGRVRLFVLGMVLEDGHVSEVYTILY